MPIGDIRPGDRVGAMLGSEDDKTVYFLGYGTYLGDEVPPEELDASSPLCKIARLGDVPNPKIQLDNGDVVWGCETWWGTEDAMKRRITVWEQDGFTIVMANIADARARASTRTEA